MSAKEQEFLNTYSYDGDTTQSDASSCYGGSQFSYSSGSSGGVSLISTETTYGSYGSWYGGDTHASGYEADTESMASTK